MLNDVLRVKRSDPIYNAHSYLTKVPVGAIIPFIEEYSPEGGLVVDMFAGSGMTAIASKMTNRNALVSDISVLGRHIGLGYLSSVEAEDLHKTANDVVSDSKANCGYNYKTIRNEDDQEVDFGKTIWSFVYECSHCQNELVYYELLKTNSFKTTGLSCPKCNNEFQKRGATYLKDVPVIVSVNGVNGKQVEQPVQDFDFDLIQKAEESNVFDNFPNIQIPKDREMYKRSALEKWDLTETKKFFSYRNAIVLSDLWNRINAVENESLRQKLRFTFTAILPRASRRYQWSLKAPLNAAIQNYYIAPVYYEWNVYDLFLRKINAVAKADGVISDSVDHLTTTQDYVNASADQLPHLESESVDFIFTDPPFGSNIFYADMNLFHEAWIGGMTDNSREAVMKTTGKHKQQSKEDYQEILTGAFSEAWRTLKEGAYLAVVFGNSQGSIWSVVQQSIYNAGFVSKPEKILILDKGQRSVKGLNSGTEKVATLDLIVVVKKDSSADTTPIALSDNYRETVKKTIDNIELSSSLTASHVYLEVLRTAMSDHVCMANLDLHDVLVEIESRGFSIDSQSGYLVNNL
ncbi:DNA methyltransferase [Pseudoalteromonas sp. H105]|uniref:DNA methyltransferase n=1 Tax=Pseudoalteromonas sp. H105 TaxID=1348393 RepID=UPI0007320258|nr:DNA methyltransferase [Pseudoalteromonas sp. H105]KTF12232.1 hypothetical protein ATS75_18500 [Pseudoalteromonas sp. H105]